ncbi:MAG: DUF5518 domain-containing protein [Methanobacterium sp.]
MLNEIIKWKPVIIGIVIVVSLYVLSDVISGQSILLTSFILAGIAVGFMVGGKIKNGAINGVVMGLIAGLITSILLLIILAFQGYGAYLNSMLSNVILYLVVEIFLGALGGILGTLIQAESYEEVD